jgi:alpha/beta superfamily hydrolase
VRRLSLVGCVTILLCSTNLAWAQSPETIYKAEGARASQPVATIAYGNGPLQMADLRVPAGEGPFPVAVIMHGGCFKASVDNRRGIAALADALGQKGFATWNIEYRRVGDPGGGWPGTFQDVAHAVDKLAEVAPRYRLDLDRVTIVGHSAGAFFALWAASRPRLAAPWSATPIHPHELAQVCGEPVIAPLMGGTPSEKPAEYLIASPQDHLPLGLRQLLVPADLGEFMQSYIAAARQGGDEVEVLTPRDANHFDVVTPSTPNGRAVVDFIAEHALDGAPR